MLWLIPAATGALTWVLNGAQRRQIRKAAERAETFEPAKLYQRNPDVVDGIATVQAMKKAKLFASHGYYCGHIGEGLDEKTVTYGGTGHVQVIGGTGDGKTSSFLSRNVGDTSNLILESKDEEISRTAAVHLARFGPVQVIRVHGGYGPLPKGIKEVSYNLLSPVIFAPRDYQLDAAESIAAGWIGGIGSSSENHAYFANSALSILTLSIVAQVRYAPERDKNLPALARELSGNAEQFFRKMAAKKDPELSPLFRGFLNEIEEKSRSFNDALQTLRVELKELISPLVAKAFSGPPSKIFDDLGRRVGTVILSERASKTGASKIQRVFAAAAFASLLRLDRPRKVPIRIHVEEAHALSGLEALPHAILTGRSYKLSVCCYWNDVGVIRRNFPVDHTSILANSAVLLFLGGTKEIETARLVSEMSGITDCIVPNAGTHYDLNGVPSVNRGKSIGQRPVIAPHDFMNMKSGSAVAFVKNCPGAILLKHRPWFRTFRKFLYGKNPFHS